MDLLCSLLVCVQFSALVEITNYCKGAGKAGQNIATRLEVVGISSLIIDSEEFFENSWCALNSQNETEILERPGSRHWPMFSPKAQLSDEPVSTTSHIWAQTRIQKSSYDEATRKWTVTLNRTIDGKTQTHILHPKVRLPYHSSYTS